MSTPLSPKGIIPAVVFSVSYTAVSHKNNITYMLCILVVLPKQLQLISARTRVSWGVIW